MHDFDVLWERFVVADSGHAKMALSIKHLWGTVVPVADQCATLEDWEKIHHSSNLIVINNTKMSLLLETISLTRDPQWLLWITCQ